MTTDSVQLHTYLCAERAEQLSGAQLFVAQLFVAQLFVAQLFVAQLFVAQLFVAQLFVAQLFVAQRAVTAYATEHEQSYIPRARLALLYCKDTNTCMHCKVNSCMYYGLYHNVRMYIHSECQVQSHCRPNTKVGLGHSCLWVM